MFGLYLQSLETVIDHYSVVVSLINGSDLSISAETMSRKCGLSEL